MLMIKLLDFNTWVVLHNFIVTFAHIVARFLFNITSCKLTMAHKNIFVDLTGQRFGKLVEIKRTENNKSGAVMWLCQCDCGNEKITSSGSLRSGGTKSCGCIQTVDLIGQRFGQLTVLVLRFLINSF
jgi:hypothetical protein